MKIYEAASSLVDWLPHLAREEILKNSLLLGLPNYNSNLKFDTGPEGPELEAITSMAAQVSAPDWHRTFFFASFLFISTC